MTRSIGRGKVMLCAAVALVVAGCSFSASTSQEKTVDKADVADQISTKVNEKAGHKPQSVTCPGRPEGSRRRRPRLPDDRPRADVRHNVTVTSVAGDKVNFDIVETVNKHDVAKQISDQLTQQFGRTPDVTCPDNLKADLGATTRCQLQDQGSTYGVTVTVTSVEGGDVKYNFKVDDQPE